MTHTHTQITLTHNGIEFDVVAHGDVTQHGSNAQGSDEPIHYTVDNVTFEHPRRGRDVSKPLADLIAAQWTANVDQTLIDTYVFG